VAEVAARYRVSPDKVRSWIRQGQLFAINTTEALSRKPRFVIPPDALAAFERGRAAADPPKPPRRRRPRKTGYVDYFPEGGDP
jgi:hypothetical protein